MTAQDRASAEVRWIDVTEAAKLIRKRLKGLWPTVKFSVKSSRFAGGSSVTVKWTDGPTQPEVDKVIQAYSGGGFDGSIDLEFSVSSWLHADGTVTFASTGGTAGSRGSVPAQMAPPQGDAELVRFAAKYIHAERKVSVELIQAAVPLVQTFTRTIRLGGMPGHCRSCGQTLRQGPADFLPQVDPTWPVTVSCGKPTCAAMQLVKHGVVRPRGIPAPRKVSA